MYNQYDVVVLHTGDRGTIVEVYDSEHFLLDLNTSDGSVKVIDISANDIEEVVYAA